MRRAVRGMCLVKLSGIPFRRLWCRFKLAPQPHRAQQSPVAQLHFDDSKFAASPFAQNRSLYLEATRCAHVAVSRCRRAHLARFSPISFARASFSSPGYMRRSIVPFRSCQCDSHCLSYAYIVDLRIARDAPQPHTRTTVYGHSALPPLYDARHATNRAICAK